MWVPVVFLICGTYASILSATSLASRGEQAFVLTEHNEAMMRRTTRSATSSKTTLHVTSVVMSRFSRVTFVNKIENDLEEAKEVTFSVRLPEAAFINEFNMVVGGLKFIGKIKEKETAEKQYQQAVERGNTAGIVSADVRETQTFDVSASVPAKSSAEFHLVYQQLLKRRLGRYDHVILVDPRQVLDEFEVTVYITERSGITYLDASWPEIGSGGRGKVDRGLESKINAEAEIRRSKYQAKVTFKPDATQQRLMLMLPEDERKFTVTYDVTRENLGGELQTRNGYFVHFFAPADLPILPKKVVFVIDRSGSMSGRKMEQTKSAFVSVLKELRNVDQFNVITFASDVKVWKDDGVVSVSEETIESAVEYVKGIDASGSTNFNDAVLKAAKLLSNVSKDEKTSSMVVVLTDGLPTYGVTNLAQIRLNVKNEVNRRFSVFCLGFGDDLDHDFLNRLANENDGISRRIYEDSDADLQLERFFQEVATPLLLNVKMRYTGTRQATLSKTKFDKYFGGSEVVVVGVIKAEQRVEAVVEGVSVEGKEEYSIRGKEIDPTFQHWFEDTGDFENFIERMWAYFTIRELLEEKNFEDSKNEADKMTKRVRTLALKYGFVTPLTSMVVTLPEDEITTTAAPKPTVRPTLPPCFFRGEDIPKHMISPPIWCPFIMGERQEVRQGGQSSPQRISLGRTAGSVAQVAPKPFSPKSKPSLAFSGYPWRECVKTLTTDEGEITIPTRRNDYAYTCKWTIDMSPGSFIDVYAESLDTLHNSVKITNRGDVLLEHNGGTSSPRYILVQDNTVTITMTIYTDDRRNDGIKISYKKYVPQVSTHTSVVDRRDNIEQDCLRTFNLTANPVGNISSPNYPGTYHNNAGCTWMFEHTDTENMQLRLTFLDLDIETGNEIGNCSHDVLHVTYKKTEESFCGYELPDPITTNANITLLAFFSDDKLGASGFKIHYEYIPKKRRE